jgi:acylphosphatase
MKRRVRLQIKGVVQGVSFRWSMEREARALGVCGWVRNRRDGSVESIAEAEEELLKQLVEWAHEGPPGARVTNVDAEWSDATGEFARFQITH